MPVIIHENGVLSDFRPKGDEFTLSELEKAIGGDIEIIPVNPWDDIIMVVGEEGLAKGKRHNRLASEMVGHHIVGDVVIMEREDKE